MLTYGPFFRIKLISMRKKAVLFYEISLKKKVLHFNPKIVD